MDTDKKIRPVEIFAGTNWQAEMVRSLLENEKIEAFIKDGIIGSLGPWWAAPGGAGSVTVFVSSQDFEQAKLIVDKYERNLK